MDIITIVGRSGSGKTTLIEGLVGYYKKMGRKISIIKHMKHDFNVDYEGKDTWRYRKAGAFSSLITNDKGFALMSDIDDGSSPLDLARLFLKGSDIVVIEGYKEGYTAKIEVIGDSAENPLFASQKENIIAVVSDNPVKTDLPCFKRNDIKKIGDFIDKFFKKEV